MRRLILAVPMMAVACATTHRSTEPGLTPPLIIQRVRPDFTEARQEKGRGLVAVAVQVKADGTVGYVRVRQSARADVDAEIVKAAKQWRFKPGMKDGKAVPIVVNAPLGETTIECVRCCGLAWVERGVNPNSAPMQTFRFACDGAARCSSHKVGGWIKP